MKVTTPIPATEKTSQKAAKSSRCTETMEIPTTFPTIGPSVSAIALSGSTLPSLSGWIMSTTIAAPAAKELPCAPWNTGAMKSQKSPCDRLLEERESAK